MRLRVRAGRPLAETDTAASPPVVVVNRTFAVQYLGEKAVGQRLALGVLGIDGQTDWEVVGVVEDMRQGGMRGIAPGSSAASTIRCSRRCSPPTANGGPRCPTSSS